MNTASEALANAAKTFHWTVGMCDNFVANMYGFGNSGYDSASVHWNSLPAQDKHPGDMNAPAGSLMFWGGGYGHVAISDGNGGIYSTDIPNSGDVSHVNASYVGRVWGKPYLGWSTPVFQGQVGGSVGGGNSPVKQAFDPSDPLGLNGIEGDITSGIASGFKSAITTFIAGFGSSVIKWGLWGGEFILGLALMVMALFLLVKGTPIEAHVRRGVSANGTE